MKQRKRRRTNAGRRGFTLIEILIVAALISLFSALAIFSTQYLVESSKRKSSIADAATISNALAIVHMDLGMFPKLGYLNYSAEMLRDGTGLVPDFEYIGFALPNPRQSAMVIEKWQGPYLPSSAQRQIISAARVGYNVRVRMPTKDASGQDVVVNWPADPYGNPYVVYLVQIDELGSILWATTPTTKPNYRAVVVSYGKNRLPGLSDDTRGLTDAALQDAEAYWLFQRDPLRTQTGAEFLALKPEEYELPRNRLYALRKDFGAGVDRYLPTQPDALRIGILDEGSDDVVVDIK